MQNNAAFSLVFSLAQSQIIGQQHGDEVASAFTRWWTTFSDAVPPSATQREYDDWCLTYVDEWLDKTVYEPQRIAEFDAAFDAAAVEKAKLESEVTTIQTAWGISPYSQLDDSDDPDKAKRIDRVLKRGTQGMRAYSYRDDACNDAWVKLLQKTAGILDDKKTGNVARTAARDIGRKVYKEIAISQFTQEGDKHTRTLEELDTRQVIHGDFAMLVAEDARDQHRRRILLQFRRERLDDFMFLMAHYLGGGKKPREDRKRAFTIVSRLRRLEKLEHYS